MTYIIPNRRSSVDFILDVQANTRIIKSTFAVSLERTMNRIFLLFVIALGLLSPVRAEETPSAKAILARALNTAREIDDDYDRARALADVFFAQSRLGDEQAASQLETELIEIAKATPDAGFRDKFLRRLVAIKAGSWVEVYESETFEGAVAYLETAGADAATSDYTQAAAMKIRDAIAVSRLIEDPEDRFWALWSIVRPAIENRRFILLREPVAEALTTAQLISNNSTRSEISTIIAWLQTLSGDRSGARSTLVKAISTAHSLLSEADRADALCYLAAAQFAAGDEPAAKTTAEEALQWAKQFGSPEALQRISAWEAKIGNVPLALATARAIEEDEEGVFALVEVAAAQAAAGGDGAAETLREAIARLEKSEDDHEINRWLIGVLQSALAAPDNMSDFLSAIVALKHHFGFFFWSSARMAIATAPAIAHNLDTLIATIAGVEDREVRLLTLWAIGESLLLAGDQPTLQRLSREALGIIHSAMASGESSIGLIEFRVALPIIALAQAEGGDSEGALRTVDEMLALHETNDEVLQQAANVRARAGAIALAIATAEGIADPGTRVRALTAVVLGGQTSRIFYPGI